MIKNKAEINDIEGVIRIKINIPFDIKFVCVYLFYISDKLILMDAGINFIKWKKSFLYALAELDISVEAIDYCIVSHEHMDHSGLLKFLKRNNPELKIIMHEYTEKTLRLCSNSKNNEITEQNAQQIAKEFIKYGMERKYVEKIIKNFLMWPKLMMYSEPSIIVKKDRELSFGKGKNLKFIWTPGHSIGHICTFNTENSHLFSGDHVLSRITPHIGNYHLLSLFDKKYVCPNIIDLYLKSFEKIENLKPKIIFPAHQEVIYNPLERIAAIKEHHNKRFEEIVQLIENRPLTPVEIAKLHFGEELNDMNKYLAFNEVLSHLIFLENKGKVKRLRKNDKIVFTAIFS
ncbi:MAG: MBL fold metallo-hydrolase [Promethearchaeota archaeon]